MAFGRCFLSGRFGPVERHHIFGGALRGKSERYGLVVELSPEMHREGPAAAHRCRETAEFLKRYGQRKVMLDQGWDAARFIREFGRNYLEAGELEEIETAMAPAAGGGKHLAPEERDPVHAGRVRIRFTVTAEELPF